MKIKLFIVLALISFSTQAEIITKVVDYTDGDIKMKGYLAYDESAKGERPGIIVVHEWWVSKA